MKQSDPPDLVGTGTLPRPGPIGRTVRALLGVFCLLALAELVHDWRHTADEPFSTLHSTALMLVVALWFFNDVVNIGFARSWGHRPLVVSMGALGIAAAFAWFASGSFDSPILGVPVDLWLAYFYGHLGVSFVLSAVTGTPGCEMRSIPELVGRLRGTPAQERRCPASFINGIDAWEQHRRVPGRRGR